MEEFFYNGCICPVCENGVLKLINRDLEFEYNNDKIILNREVWECSECKESFLQAKDEREAERILTDHRRKIDGLLTSEEIKRIRKQLNLTQVELAKILRVGEKNFARYETGQTTQGYAMDDLLRILRKYPETIDVLLRLEDHKIPQKQADQVVLVSEHHPVPQPV